MEQIKDIENSFIVADDIEVGFGNKLPLISDLCYNIQNKGGFHGKY